jgi:hypothetical protein
LIIGFIDWLTEEAIKKKGKKNDSQSNQQRDSKVGAIDQQGQANRTNQEITANDFHYIAEP